MKAVGIILAGGSSNKMRELTRKRAAAAMPIAGSYRAIDFALSNMSNSGISKAAVLTQYNARSLNEHLNSSIQRYLQNFLGVYNHTQRVLLFL